MTAIDSLFVAIGGYDSVPWNPIAFRNVIVQYLPYIPTVPSKTKLVDVAGLNRLPYSTKDCRCPGSKAWFWSGTYGKCGY